MDFENMMITPAMYRDIPSSFMMQPMPAPMMPMYGGYPAYGVSGLRPALANDKFDKLAQKDTESKNAVKKTAVALTILTAAGILFSKKFKSGKKLFPKLRTHIKTSGAFVKTKISNAWTGIKNIFKKKTP